MAASNSAASANAVNRVARKRFRDSRSAGRQDWRRENGPREPAFSLACIGRCVAVVKDDSLPASETFVGGCGKRREFALEGDDGYAFAAHSETDLYLALADCEARSKRASRHDTGPRGTINHDWDRTSPLAT